MTKSRFIPVLLLTALALSHAPASEMQLAGGALTVNGTLELDRLLVNAGSVLRGDGTVNGPVTVAGTVSPGTGPVEAAGTLTVNGVLTVSNGVFLCHAATHTVADRLNVFGLAGGDATVTVSKTAGAIPVDLVIVDAATGSTYSGFRCPQTNWMVRPGGDGDLLLTDLYGDSDADTMPDWWEMAYDATRTGMVSTADNDGDGIPNRDEYRVDTSPTNSASFFAVVDIRVDESRGRYTVEWSAVTSRTYRVDASPETAPWQRTNLASGIRGTPGANTYTGTLHDERAFFRVSVENPR